MTDSLSDLLSRIKNGYMANKKDVTCYLSKKKLSVAKILEKEGFVEKVEIDNSILKITLKYPNKKPGMVSFNMISKPGLRVYIKNDKIKKPFGGIGISVISTPKGVMTGTEAKKQKLGGELLCQVW